MAHRLRTNNVYSDTITIEIRQQLDDGTFLVLEHTDCSPQYKADHPDRYRVMSEAELIEVSNPPAKRKTKNSAVALEPRPGQPTKFDAAYLERRMREHREWQEQTTRELLQDLADAALEVRPRPSGAVLERGYQHERVPREREPRGKAR